MRPLIVLALLAASAGAQAQYKCTSAGGAVTFQQQPCPPGQKELALDVKPNGGTRAAASAPAAASSTPPARAAAPASAASAPAAVPRSEGSADQRILARYAQQDRVAALERDLQSVRDEIAQRASQKAADVAAVRTAYQRALDAGEPGAPAAMNAALRSIEDKYRAMAELDRQRLDAAQAAVDKAKAQPAP
ncbi:MAG: DUF4124 domain-containing protein [Burkholderiaceae bacterium]